MVVVTVPAGLQKNRVRLPLVALCCSITLVGGVTVQSFCCGRIAVSVSNRTVIYARLCGRENNICIWLPVAKTGPMVSELVKIHDSAIDNEVGSARSKGIDFCGGEGDRGNVPQFSPLNICFPGVAGKQGVEMDKSSECHWGERRRLVFIDNFYNGMKVNLQSHALADILNLGGNRNRAGKVVGDFRFNTYPRPLVNFKVMSQIVPLSVGDYGIPNSKRDSDHLKQMTPPLKGLIPGIIGLCCIWWGWWNLQREQRLPASGIVFLCGCALWAGACCVLLPWSIS